MINVSQHEHFANLLYLLCNQITIIDIFGNLIFSYERDCPSYICRYKCKQTSELETNNKLLFSPLELCLK